MLLFSSVVQFVQQYVGILKKVQFLIEYVLNTMHYKIRILNLNLPIAY